MGRIARHVVNVAVDSTATLNFGFNNEYQRLVRVKCDYTPAALATSDLTITDGDSIVAFSALDSGTDFDQAIDYDVAPLVKGPLTFTMANGGVGTVSIWLEK